MQTETIELTDPETDETYTYTLDKHIQCEHCQYRWESQSDARRPTCPNCSTKTDRNYIYTYHFYVKMAAPGYELPSVETIYSECRSHLEQTHNVSEDAEISIFIDGGGNLVATVNKNDEYALKFGPSIVDISMDEIRTDTDPIESTSRNSDRWPSRPPQTLAPYTASLRRSARRLEVLKENGWSVESSDGEHVFLEKN